MQFLVYCKKREKYDEAFLGSLQKGFKTGFNQAQQAGGFVGGTGNKNTR